MRLSKRSALPQQMLCYLKMYINAAHCSEVHDLIVRASFINTATQLQLKRYGSHTVSA